MLLLYNLRILERTHSTPHFVSLIILLYFYTLPFLLLPHPTSPGPTFVLFALLHVYKLTVPQVYRLKIGRWTVSDKIAVYLLAADLIWIRGLNSVIDAITGWIVGGLVKRELLWGKGWRVPGWKLK